MLSWNDEMDNMLGTFNSQVKFTLKNIKMAFGRNGLAINNDFKQYFLRVSYDRIKTSYDEFEISSIFEDASTSATHENPNLFHTPRNDINDIQQTTNDPFEIIDSSDEEDQASKMERTIRYNGHGISHQSNDYVEFDNDGSYTEMSNMKSNLFDYQRDFSQNRNGHRIRIEMENAMKAEVMELDDGFPIAAIDVHRAMNTTVQNTSTVNLNNAANNVNGAKKNNMRGRSVGRQKNPAEVGSTPKLLQSKKSTSPNTMGTKKRFQCEVCEYSSNHKGQLNVHTRIHTGEKPYRCDICLKEFTQSHHMRKHKVAHTEKIPFHCRGCLNGFSQKAERDAHEKVCKRRRYECHVCKKFVTVGITHLKGHMRTHNGEKPFRCEICMVRFTMKSSLKKHLDTIHTRINA